MQEVNGIDGINLMQLTLAMSLWFAHPKSPSFSHQDQHCSSAVTSFKNAVIIFTPTKGAREMLHRGRVTPMIHITMLCRP